MPTQRFLLAAVLSMAAALAAPIPGLVSTGTVAPGLQDPNWLYSPNLGGTFLSPFVTQIDSATNFPFYAWAANDSASRWISPQAGYGLDFNVWGDLPGQYMYRLIFNIPSNAILNTGTFTYRIATDNVLHSVWLNGHLINTDPIGFTSLSSPYTVGPGTNLFLAGQNILDIFVVNTGLSSGTGSNQVSWNPTGLRLLVESSNIDFAAPPPPPEGVIPEPGTMLMFACGLCAVGLMRFRRIS